MIGCHIRVCIWKGSAVIERRMRDRENWKMAWVYRKIAGTNQKHSPAPGEEGAKQLQEYIEITGYEGDVVNLRIPEQLEGLPVRSIGSRAFARRADLQFVRLPESVDTLRQYAFYNCPNLRQIQLHDRIEDYYDGVIKQCSSLAEIEVFLHEGHYTVVRDMLADNDRKMNFILHFTDKENEKMQEIHLTFPAYVYDFVEDVEARVLHHKIEGSGYAYRECVTRKGIDYRTYDQLFSAVVDDEPAAAVDIAFDRLMFPYELEKQAEERYRNFLREWVQMVLENLIEDQRQPQKSEERVRFLAEQELIGETELQHSLDLAARERRTVISAILLEYHQPNTGGNPFMLEDW